MPTPRGRCRLAPTVEDRRPPLPPLSRTAPHYSGPGRKGVRPEPRHPGAAELKRRAQRPMGTTAPEEGEVLPSGARGGGAGGGARTPGGAFQGGRAGWLRGRGPGGWGLGLAPRPGELGVGG